MDLTEAVVLSRAKVNSLLAVRMLNMWGAGLRGVSILARLSNVEVVSLSMNQLESLRDFAGCASLRELYLRKNRIRDVMEPDYRCAVLQACTRLSKLDDADVPSHDGRKGIPPANHAAASTDSATQLLTAEEQQAPLSAEAEAASTHMRPGTPTAESPRAVPVAAAVLHDSEEVVSACPSAPGGSAPPRHRTSRQDRVLHAVVELLHVLDTARLARVAAACADLLSRSRKGGVDA